MDPEAFLDLANQVVKLKMFPYFDIAHSVLCALHVREDLGPGKLREVFMESFRALFSAVWIILINAFMWP